MRGSSDVVVGRTAAGRMLVVVATTCASVLVLTACGTGPTEPTVTPSGAKRSIVEHVQDASEVLGGDWERYSGPAVISCGQASGAAGTAYKYILERRDTDGTDPAADVAAIHRTWEQDGIAVEDFQGGGNDPTPGGVRGTGGPVLSIGFDAYPGRYSITGVSQCSDGDPSVLRDEH